MPLHFKLDDLPTSGSVVTFSRRPDESQPLAVIQTFRLFRVDTHTTTEGKPSAVLHWRSDCTECGESYKFRSGLTTAQFYRRCKKCRTGRKTGGWTHGPRIQHALVSFTGDVPPVEQEDDAGEAEAPVVLKGHKALDAASYAAWMSSARAAIPGDNNETNKQARRDWIDARLAEEAAAAQPVVDPDDIDPASLF